MNNESATGGEAPQMGLSCQRTLGHQMNGVEETPNPMAADVESRRWGAVRVSVIEKTHPDIIPIRRSNRDLSSLASQQRRQQCSQGGVIFPRTKGKRYWDGYVLLLVLYSASFELVRETFLEGSPMDAVDWLVDFSYWCDIALSFLTGFVLEDGTQVMDPRKIVRRYATSWLVIDVVSTIPYQAFESTRGRHWSVLRLLRITRLWRVLRAGGNGRDIIDMLVARFGLRQAIIDILRFVMGILLVMHVLCCAFHLLGMLEKETGNSRSHLMQFGMDGNPAQSSVNWLDHYGIADVADEVPHIVTPRTDSVPGTGGGDSSSSRPTMHDGDSSPAAGDGVSGGSAILLTDKVAARKVPLRIKYLYSLYWAITTVTTIGYGDITPVSDIEIMFTMIAELIGMFIFVYTTNSVSSLLRGLNAKRSMFQAHLDLLQEYMESHATPMELRKRVVEYLTFINSPKCLSASISMDEDTMLAPLSTTLREELRMAAYVPWLQRNRVCQSLPESFVYRISLLVRSLAAAPGDLIINAADGEGGAQTIYILFTGEVRLYGSDDGSGGAIQDLRDSAPIRVIDRESKLSVFGSYELFPPDQGPVPPEWCIEASEFCDIAHISRSAFRVAVREEDVGDEQAIGKIKTAFPWLSLFESSGSTSAMDTTRVEGTRSAPVMIPRKPNSRRCDGGAFASLATITSTDAVSAEIPVDLAENGHHHKHHPSAKYETQTWRNSVQQQRPRRNSVLMSTQEGLVQVEADNSPPSKHEPAESCAGGSTKAHRTRRAMARRHSITSQVAMPPWATFGGGSVMPEPEFQPVPEQRLEQNGEHTQQHEQLSPSADTGVPATVSCLTTGITTGRSLPDPRLLDNAAAASAASAMLLQKQATERHERAISAMQQQLQLMSAHLLAIHGTVNKLAAHGGVAPDVVEYSPPSSVMATTPCTSEPATSGTVQNIENSSGTRDDLSLTEKPPCAILEGDSSNSTSTGGQRLADRIDTALAADFCDVVSLRGLLSEASDEGLQLASVNALGSKLEAVERASDGLLHGGGSQQDQSGVSVNSAMGATSQRQQFQHILLEEEDKSAGESESEEDEVVIEKNGLQRIEIVEDEC